MSEQSRGGGFLLVTALIAGAGFLIWNYISGIIFFGVLALVHVLYVMRIIKMHKTIEDVRHGKVTRSILGFFLFLVLEYLFFKSSLYGDVGQRGMPQASDMINYISPQLPYIWFGMMITGLMLSVGIVGSIQGKLNPSMSEKYMLALSIAIVASAFTCGLLAVVQIAVVPISRSSYIAFDLSRTTYPLFPLLVITHLLMSRLHVDEGEEVTVYFFESQLYGMNAHGDLIVPPLLLSLQFFFDLIGQRGIGFTLHYSAMHLPRVAPERIELARVEPGHQPVLRQVITKQIDDPSQSDQARADVIDLLNRLKLKGKEDGNVSQIKGKPL